MEPGTIKFKVKDIDEVKSYAAEKGFLRVGDLARFALYQYMAQYKGGKHESK